MLNTVSGELLDFIKASPTPFHAVKNLKDRLFEEGYRELFENEKWSIVSGGKYFVSRGASSLIAFRVPESANSFRAVLSHLDSPAFKLKQNFQKESSGAVKLSHEVYGGPILESFYDKNLSLAGRVVVSEEDSVSSRLFELENACIIPRIAPHLAKDSKPNPAIDMFPICSLGKTDVLGRIADLIGVTKESILSYDIYVINGERGVVWGENGEFITSPRIDNLQSVFTSFVGFLNSFEETSVPVMCVFDKEEVGSGGENGADSTFLYDVLRRVSMARGDDTEDFLISLASSLFVSADVAHAYHPNYPESFDAQNTPVMNKGIALKFNSNAKYTTDGQSAGVFMQIAKLAQVPVQIYHNRSDIAGGSTLGRYSLSHLSVPCVDVGAGIFAMHSANETAGTLDTEYLARVFEMFYSVHIEKNGTSYIVQ